MGQLCSGSEAGEKGLISLAFIGPRGCDTTEGRCLEGSPVFPGLKSGYFASDSHGTFPVRGQKLEISDGRGIRGDFPT